MTVRLVLTLLASIIGARLAAADAPGKLEFSGGADAVLFSREVNDSLQGVLEHNYISAPRDGMPAGFLRASPAPQPWFKTMWTRDAGCFLRELANWGYFDQAKQVARCIIAEAPVNADGFVAVSRYFSAGDRSQPGAEVDGQAAIVIGLVSLWQRLPPNDPFRADLYRYLHQPSSPVRYFHHILEHAPLIPGSGEFGGGAQPFGQWDNVVQNNLSALALLDAAEMESAAGDAATAALWRRDSDGLFAQIQKHLVGADGAWLWCVDPHSLQPERGILDRAINVGFGGINGVLCMDADVLGFAPHGPRFPGLAHSELTFQKLYSTPMRREQFDRYGIWTQFDRIADGYITSPSYGQGYAIQCMLLLDRLPMAGHALHFLADATEHPGGESFEHGRLSPTYFYERLYSPDAAGKTELAAGCGPLNLVNVAEPLKVARLIAGVDDTSPDDVRILPRLPPGWTAVHLTHWPIRTPQGTVRADLTVTRTDEGDDCDFSVQLQVENGGRIPHLDLRLPGPGGYCWTNARDVNHLER